MREDVLTRAFATHSSHLLSVHYMNCIRTCLDVLNNEDIWWKPNARSNSVGNLLLHLAGNVRQWILHGVGGQEDTRQRSEEFIARGGANADELFTRLESTVQAAAATIRGLDAADLLQRRTIQGVDVTTMEAVYHVVEHFSTHVGQLVYITKLRTGRDLALINIRDDGTADRSWLPSEPMTVS